MIINTKHRFDKKPLSFQEQVTLLQSRGLVINDESRAIRHLSYISYYRLSAYMLPFKEYIGEKPINKFKKGVKWDDVISLYIFDRKLRLLIFDAIERIEVALRTEIVYILSHKYGSHWHDKKDIFSIQCFKDNSEYDVYEDIQKRIRKERKNTNKEVFLDHYWKTYSSPQSPPSWMSIEILYLGQLSKLCQNLKNKKDLSAIANSFNLPSDVFCSWLHTLNYLRNICAHHARLWNRHMMILPSQFKSKKYGRWLGQKKVQQRRIYYSICIIQYFLNTINPTSSFVLRLKSLLAECNISNLNLLGYMGFPEDWETDFLQ